jgi:hypothetical protein
MQGHEKAVRGCGRPPFEGSARWPYGSRRRSVTGLTPATSHSPPQWWGWVSPRELVRQGRGVMPRRMMAPPRRAIKCPYPRAGTGVRVREPRARRSPLEGAVNPRVRRNPLEGTFEWAALVGHGDHRSASRAPLVCISEMCLTLVFFRF